MAVSSLPGGYHSGDFGMEAYNFVDFLERTGQRWWQILPLNPMDETGSPFKSHSSLAIDVSYLSVMQLVREGYLDAAFITSHLSKRSTDRADFAESKRIKRLAVQEAYRRFTLRKVPAGVHEAFEAFRKANASWLQPHSSYLALAEDYGYDFSRWGHFLAVNHPSAVRSYRRGRPLELGELEYEQFLLQTQWNALRTYAHQRGIGIIGDMPLYVGYASADVWANQRAFQLNDHLRPSLVSGYPPCSYYQYAQLWDTPVYHWEHLHEDDYAFWVERFRRAYQLYDVVRLDHFMGLHEFYAVAAGAPHARLGKWLPARGDEMLHRIRHSLGRLSLIAEDLGAAVPEPVHELRRKYGIPGMRIAQFGPPQGEVEAASVAYPGNHDMPTLSQWLKDQNPNATQVEHWAQIQKIMESKSNLVILPMQDIYELGAESRMNVPGTWSTAKDSSQRRENWVWRHLEWVYAPGTERMLFEQVVRSGRR